MSEVEAIPGTEKYEFKPGFIERYSALTDFELLKKYCLSFMKRSIRVNTIRASVESVRESISAKGWELVPIPWCSSGFWISHPDRRDVGNLQEYKLGKIYVQEAVSMIPPLVLEAQPGETVLDMCSAPGSKTTQIAMMMENKGLIVANDYRGLRITALGMNLQRCGITNTIITIMNGERISGKSFDRVLVDAPCSGTGTIRKSLKTIRMWNANMVKKIANQQKKLILAGFDNLKVGGVLVYSTCSLEPEENEGMIDYLLKQRTNAEVCVVSEEVLPGLVRGEPVVFFEGKEYSSEVKKTIRVWPQDNDTGGFFIAKIVKRA